MSVLIKKNPVAAEKTSQLNSSDLLLFYLQEEFK